MKTYEEYSFDKFYGAVKDYVSEAVSALEKFVKTEGEVASDIIIKKNYLDAHKHTFFMNIKQLGEKVNNYYAFFYLAMDEQGFMEFSEIVCQANSIRPESTDIRFSAVKECCNRIGARLLKFISTATNTYDIGTPSVIPLNHKINRENSEREWPVNFFATGIKMKSIPMEFGCTILEIPQQRVLQVSESIKDIIQKNYKVSFDKETDIEEIPNIFVLHYNIRLITGEQVVLSFSKKYLAGIAVLTGKLTNRIEEVKQSIIEVINNFSNVESFSIEEDVVPNFTGDLTVIKLLEVGNRDKKLRFVLSISL